MEGYSGTREGGSGPTRRHSNTMTGRLQPHWPHPGGPDHNAVESSGRSYFKTFPKTRAACSKFALFWKASRVGHLARSQLRRGTLDPARSWSHLFGFVSSKIFQPLAMLPCLRPSPTQVCKVTLSPLFGFLWTVLFPSHLPCSARPGTGRPAPGPLGLGPIRGVTLGPGPVTLPFGPSHGQGPLHHLPSGPSHGQGPVDHLSGHSAMTFAEPSDAAL